MSVVLKVENVSKQYRLGTVGSGTLRDDMTRFWAKLTGKEDPTLKVGEINDRTKKGNSDYVWALNDINFEVKQGEVLGVIGKNGAGKSTLLKILSKVTAPTTGRIRAKGRIASLLEVGTGFHPELTGRENIYLNGAILGMTKAEIKAKLDEIVDFSGVEKYLDTPVKRYSSGMTVRLGFAVAAHLEPEILIVDEVLAVGDAEFQKKAIGKMQDVSKGEGRTVLFVSHNMHSISLLCNKGVLLSNGTVNYSGDVEEAISKYLQQQSVFQCDSKVIWNENSRPGDEIVELISAEIIDERGKYIEFADVSSKVGVKISYKNKIQLNQPRLSIHLKTGNDITVFCSVDNSFINSSLGVHEKILWIPENFLNNEEYFVSIAMSTFEPHKLHLYENNVIRFNINDELGAKSKAGYEGKLPGVIRPIFKWQ
ncbi:ABC transporter ATP-binding protein [Chondrinema litorale]|uniref:ABC transporter ATP-binding protein n=1 Tax=Chondrinema litorale TaxID=2994555 RepID=UPI002542FC94|nr:ABC transporter ATP-binding protein [Chondrinema litorale]UZR92529.1 ABC transporter ATP-binding protein [Chondrinema litorale]